MSDIQKGDRIRIKSNLGEVLTTLGFDPGIPEAFQKRFAGTFQTAHDLWTNADGTVYVTVDLCCEIPLQCCELIAP